jgi:DNA end-binding protein Ku
MTMFTTALTVTEDAADPMLSDAAIGPAPARPSWSGLLSFRLLAVPVKAYPATVTAPELPCHQLHVGCGQRLRHLKHCPEHGPVDSGAVAPGYEYAPGQHLVLDPVELDQLRPARDRALTLEHFLDPTRLDPTLYAGRSLYLVPAGPAARPAVTVLAQVLARRRQAALGRVVLNGRRRLLLVRPVGSLLAAHLLHFPGQVRNPAALETALRPVAVVETELRLAEQLIEACSGPVVWSDYRDDSATALAALVEAKLQGQPPAPANAPEDAPVLGLLEALRQSVAALPRIKGRPAPVPPLAPKQKRSALRRSS